MFQEKKLIMKNEVLSLESSPIRAISLFIHKAILREGEAIVAEAARARTVEDAQALEKRIAHFKHNCHQHVSGEEKGLFSFIGQRFPNNDRHYLFDHKEEAALFHRAHTAARDAAEGRGGEQPFEALHKATVALMQHISLHVRKEDNVLFTILAEQLTAEEQKNIIRRMLASHTPQEVAEVISWMLTVFDAEEREAFVRMRMIITPGPAFEELKGVIKAALPEAGWMDLTRRVPEVAA